MTAVASTERNKEEYSFIYGCEAISYEVVRKPQPQSAPNTQKKRKIAIKVQPNCEVVISSPDDAEREDIHAAVMKRGRLL